MKKVMHENDGNPLATTPKPPYYAVIFSSLRTPGDQGYDDMSARMLELARAQPGFLGVESAREGLGITVSYWASVEAITAWKQVAEHREAQRRGRRDWYSEFKVRIARVEREYGVVGPPGLEPGTKGFT